MVSQDGGCVHCGIDRFVNVVKHLNKTAIDLEVTHHFDKNKYSFSNIKSLHKPKSIIPTVLSVVCAIFFLYLLAAGD